MGQSRLDGPLIDMEGVREPDRWSKVAKLHGSSVETNATGNVRTTRGD